MNSVCFDKGELVIVEDNETTKEIKDSIVESEAYENNIHTKEEIEKMIKSGNIAQLKISSIKSQWILRSNLLLTLLQNLVMTLLQAN